MTKPKYWIRSYDGTVQRRFVKRINLFNKYRKVGKKAGRFVYERISKYINPDRIERHLSKFDKRPILRFHWKMGDRLVNDETLENLLKELREKRYDGVKNRSKKSDVQRIGVTLFRGEPIYRRRLITDDKKKIKLKPDEYMEGNYIKVDLLDFVTTTSYERTPEATDAMFEELAQKILLYEMNDQVSPSLFEDSDSNEAFMREFIVYFTQRTVDVKIRKDFVNGRRIKK